MRLVSVWRWFALVAAALVPYAHSLGYGFVDFDDPATIVELPLIRRLTWQTLPDFFRPDIYAALYEYMPLKNLSYAVDFALFGSSGPALRPQQYFWYVASVLALFAWLRGLLRRLAELERLGVCAAHAEWIAFVASVLFALHPAHVESVVWLSGRKDVLVGTFMFLALGFGLAYTSRVEGSPTKPRLAFCFASLGSLSLALLSKPTAVMTAPLLLVQEFWIAPPSVARIVRRRVLLTLHLPAWIMTAVFAPFYVSVVGTLSEWAGEEDRKLVGPPLVRIGQQLARYLQLVVDPSKLAPTIPPTVLDPSATSPLAFAGYLALIAVAALAFWGMRRRHPLALGALLFVVPILPSLLAPSWGQYVAGRYLFHALIGPAFVLAWLGAWTLEHRVRLRPLVVAALAVLCLVWTGGTVTYATAFRDSEALWAYAAQTYPRHPPFYALQVRLMLRSDHPERAVPILEQCLRENPGAADCAAPLAGLLLSIDPPRGERLLLEILPRDLAGNAHLRLALYWSHQGKTREAVNLFEGWLKRNAGAAPVMFGAMADLAIADGQFEKARKYLLQSVQSASVIQPASPPEVDAFVLAAERAGDHALAELAKRAAQRCGRTDCFAAALSRSGTGQ